jgi:glycine hydroxymethyltransferase
MGGAGSGGQPVPVHAGHVASLAVRVGEQRQLDLGDPHAKKLAENKLSEKEKEDLGKQLDDLAKKINSAVFPGTQGGPLMHVIAAKAVAFGEALRPSFKLYAKNVAENAKALAEALKSKGLDIVSGGTDTHLMLVDLRPKGLTGKVAEIALGRAHITCNKNGIPFDPEKPTITSGIRLGSPAGTTRGFGVAEFKQIGEMIVEVLDVLSQKGVDEDTLVEAAVSDKVKTMLKRFPIYQ